MSEKTIDFTIRQASAEDYPSIRNAVREAFAEADHTNGDEYNLIEKLRGSESFVPELSLVAVANGSVIGHIMGTKARIGEHTVLIPAPLSVLPEHQSEGVGTALAFRAAEIAKNLAMELSS